LWHAYTRGIHPSSCPSPSGQLSAVDLLSHPSSCTAAGAEGPLDTRSVWRSRVRRSLVLSCLMHVRCCANAPRTAEGWGAGVPPHFPSCIPNWLIATGQICPWQRTIHGGRIRAQQATKRRRRRKRLRKHNGLVPGGGSVASFFPVVLPSSPGSSSHLPCAGVTSGARAAASLGGPGSSKGKGGCGSVLRACGAHLSRD
jgi:hypothetical protein